MLKLLGEMERLKIGETVGDTSVSDAKVLGGEQSLVSKARAAQHVTERKRTMRLVKQMFSPSFFVALSFRAMIPLSDDVETLRWPLSCNLGPTLRIGGRKVQAQAALRRSDVPLSGSDAEQPRTRRSVPVAASYDHPLTPANISAL